MYCVVYDQITILTLALADVTIRWRVTSHFYFRFVHDIFAYC